GQVAVARLESRYQPDILNRNARLVGECLQQFDLPLREPSDSPPCDADRADRLALVQHWYGRDAEVVDSRREALEPVLGIFTNVRDVDDRPVHDRTRRGSTTAQRHRVSLPKRLNSLRAETVRRDDMDMLTIERKDSTGLPLA